MLKRQTIELLFLALPIMIETVLQTLLGTTDTYFAGQLTDAAISGISVTQCRDEYFYFFFLRQSALVRPLSFHETTGRKT